jgi:copper(I)-binding protein
LINNGKQPDELISARSAICAQIELRQNNRYDEPPLKSFVLNPGRPLSMRPAARHLRLIGLRQNLKVNDQFPLLLDFLRAGEIEITVLIEKQPGS